MPFTNQPLDIWKAAERGMLDEVRQFVAGGVAVDAKTRGNVTPLHHAARGGHVALVTWLLDHGANVNARTEAEPGYPGAETPLFEAIVTGRTQVVDLLLKRGAKPNVKSSDTTSPVEAAAESGNLTIVSLLLEHGADLNPKGDFGPLFAALCWRRLETARYLIQHGARIDRKVLPYSGSILMNMASSGWLPGVELLLSHGADVNQQDDTGKTALHWGVLAFGSRTLTSGRTRKGERLVVTERPEDAIPVVKRLLEAGADPAIRDKDSFTALGYARKMCAQPLIELLGGGNDGPSGARSS